MTDSGQLTSPATEIYDEFLLPALFQAWAPRLIEAARHRAGLRIADVACGTGALTIEAARAVSPGGAALGVDVHPGMPEVARRKATGIDWREAPPEGLRPGGDGVETMTCMARRRSKGKT
jgi:ubiquinone/menaquinone biosynthesis C-methylase UbiE